ncbi:hypothetical protein NG799_19090 [Laspinema sp. D1]|uniref:Uncharacterized protein n=1 Tax=Laspinema palackyanum D2a TaxID=2953684 RepID=A0ABT2MUN9_9CYAN|nr:hypothetical protein [Laspinema sp. D2a]
MAIWILTIGDSDVQLNTDDTWQDLYHEVIEEDEDSILAECEDLGNTPPEDKITKLYPVPARALGLVYQQDLLEEHWDELVFPLLDTFIREFSQNLERPNFVLILLTDQTNIFTDRQKEHIDCPFWQDTVELKTIISYYFSKHPGIEPIFLTIKPQPNSHSKVMKGIDNWEEMLNLVDQTLNKALNDNKINPQTELAYVSHQAGTPAISSALQFITISQFKSVKFLVSNRFYSDEYELQSYPTIIESSNYWRGLQIQRAKRLIEAGQPAAALEIIHDLPDISLGIIDQLKGLANRFNMKANQDASGNVTDISKEFELDVAASRIVDALDLVEILLRNESYALAITILAAAHETFLKAAILHLVSELSKKLEIIEFQGNLIQLLLIELLIWDNRGLCLSSKQELRKLLKNKGPKKHLSDFSTFIDADEELSSLIIFLSPQPHDKDYYNWSKYLSIPKDDTKTWTLNNIHEKRYFEVNNQRLVKWLWNFDALNASSPWKLMEWMGTHNRDREQDKRNQLMHNLRGVTKAELSGYLQGNPEEKDLDKNEDIVEIYGKFIKKPFREALHKVGLSKDCSMDNQLQTHLNDLASQLK